ncbi:alkene reductase [Chitinimonas sp. BJB300]|uniref:alkene reductase n=1 Tax=Chitinimonas sp. BJB300 TaxID=1559339 RepID=UPI000C0DD830|nr:alkene reductase [Chitinimonas sp. BJB300]PHV10400.1 alkene reductase [Chitinimonas sp. BJB300]TSJ83833.1 alkene reductase [Chitinimonas sp. BJB300]
MSTDKLLTPIRIGATPLANRVLMAPLTRSRASQPGDVPTQLNAGYYAQRSTAGLIISEATQISRQGQGYALTPGMYTDAQEAGWKNVVEHVHAAGGRIALQLWHVGRVSNRLLQSDNQAPVAPSAIRAEGTKTFVIQPDGTPANLPTDVPRALETTELPGIIADYVQAARRAVRTGFDFVEIHAANGYLLHQFLATNTNQRTDAYGGHLENRARLLLEVVDAISTEVGADKVGIRLSPSFTLHDIQDTEPDAMGLYLAKQFSARNVAYLHIAESDWAGGPALSDEFRNALRRDFKGALIYCGNYDAEKAEAMIQTGKADAIAFGRPFIANPDLVARFAKGAALNTPDPSTFYGGDERGYTDYPTLQH